jgi:methylphosphotriester-DNA--protein-cysteine methyltransferase
MSISSTLVDRAEIRFQPAADVLHPYVGCFWIITAKPGSTIRVVPDGSTAIAIQFRKSRKPEWMLRGPIVRPEARRFTTPTVQVGVRLRPGVAFLVTGIAAHTTVGRRIPLGAVASCRALVADQQAVSTTSEYIAALQRFLIERLENAKVHHVVARALNEIECTRGSQRIPDIAAQCGISPRHLNRLMRVWIGYGPKRFAGVVRFQTTLKEMERAPSRRGAELAADNGYFDQAHLTLDLARFTGDTPRRLASNRVSEFSKTRCD